MILAFTIVYAAMILLLGFLRRGERSASEYFVLGRTLTLPAFVASLVSSWYGGILGIGEFTYRFGISNWLVFGVPYYIAAIIFALFLAKKARESAIYTIPDLLDRRYGRKVSIAGAVVLFFMTVPGAYVLILGVLIHTVFGFSKTAGVLAGTLFSMVYVYRGGLRSVVRTDMFQFALMFLSFFAALIFCWNHFGGLSVLTARLPETHFTWHGGNPAQYVIVWYVIAMATLVEPAFYQRCFAAKSHRVARRGIFVSVLFWLVFDAMTTTVGLYARAFLPHLENPTLAFPVFAADILPPFLGAVFILGLLATVMSTIDSYAFLSAITLGRDIIWRFRGGSDESSQQLSAWGLIVTGVIAVVFALSFQSVVDIWHDFGSVGTPALLLPLAAAFSRRDLLKPGHVFLMMILAGLTSLGWLLSPYLAPSLKGSYPWGVEPIFPGLIVSAALFLLFVKRYPGPK